MRKSIRPREKTYRFNLAMPEELHRKLVIVAHQNRRSVTQQIISALEWSTREVILDEPTQPVQ